MCSTLASPCFCLNSQKVSSSCSLHECWKSHWWSCFFFLHLDSILHYIKLLRQIDLYDLCLKIYWGWLGENVLPFPMLSLLVMVWIWTNSSYTLFELLWWIFFVKQLLKNRVYFSSLGMTNVSVTITFAKVLKMNNNYLIILCYGLFNLTSRFHSMFQNCICYYMCI